MLIVLRYGKDRIDKYLEWLVILTNREGCPQNSMSGLVISQWILVCGHPTCSSVGNPVKEALYRSWCDVNRLGDSGVIRLGNTSAFVTTAGQLLSTRRGKTRMDVVGIVFAFNTAPL